MRLFLAIDLQDNIKEKIGRSLTDLKNEYQDLRWIPDKNFHITIHFFGSEMKVEKIIPKIEEALFEANSFYMYSLECGLFIRRNVLAYLSFNRCKELEKIASNIRELFNSKLRLKYQPHVTLARYRVPSRQQYLLLKKKFRNLDIDISFKVSKLTLFNCINYDTKPEYNIVKEFELQDK